MRLTILVMLPKRKVLSSPHERSSLSLSLPLPVDSRNTPLAPSSRERKSSLSLPRKEREEDSSSWAKLEIPLLHPTHTHTLLCTEHGVCFSLAIYSFLDSSFHFC